MNTSASAALLAPAAMSERKTARTSLASELERAGLRAIPNDRVERHKRAAIETLRPGALRIWAPIIAAILTGLNFLHFGTIVGYFIKRTHTEQHGQIMMWWVVGLSFTTLIGAVLMESKFGLFRLGLLCLVPVATALTLFIVEFALVRNYRLMVAIFARWELVDFDATVASGSIYVPPRARERAALAKFVPNVRIQIERLNDDPFLAVVRGWGPFQQIVRVDAWGTGDPFLDNFAS